MSKSSRHRLASPTMAQIYMRQGHFHRARETLDAVLLADPTAGAAHVLRERLALLDGPTISGRVGREGAQLDLRWTKAPADAHAVVIVFRGHDVYVTSRPCGAGDGQWKLRLDRDQHRAPRAHGQAGASAAAISLVRPDEQGSARPVAVAEPLSWG